MDFGQLLSAYGLPGIIIFAMGCVIVYQQKKITTEVYLLYNGWKYLDQYNADGEDNAQYATADGMPA